MYDARAGNFVEPVGVACTHRAVLVEEHVHRHFVQHRVAIGIIAPIIVVAQIVVRGIHTVVHASLPVGASPLAGVHCFNLVRIERGGYASIEIHLHFAVLTLFRGDDNHTVGGAATINAGRCGIFQHLNALDVVAVKLMHACFGGHTVDDVKRVVVVKSTDTTYAHCGGTRWITIGCDVHARNASL